MPQDNAASTGENSTPVVAPAVETASTATTPETPTETTSNVSLMERLGVPAEVQQELEARKPKPEPEQPAETLAKEPTAEATETPETPTEENPSEEQHEAPKEWPDSAKKRLAKERSKRGKAEERAEKAEELAEQLRAQLEATQPVTVSPTSDDLLADVTNETQLTERVQLAKAGRDFYRARLNGFTMNEGQPNEQMVSSEEVATILGRIEDVLNEHAPKKAAQLQMRKTYDEVAKKEYPDLFNPLSKDYQIAKTIVAEKPWLATDPGQHMFIGDYLRGARERIAAANKKTASSGDPAADQILNARVQTPPIAPHVPAATRSNGSTPSRQKVDQAMNNLVTDGSREALVAAVGARRQANNKTAGARELVSV